MIKKILIIILFHLSVVTSAQLPKEKWYMINGSGLIEVSYIKDSVITQKMDFDFVPKRNRKADAYAKALFLKDRTVLIFQSQQDKNCYRKTTTLFQVKPGISCQVALNDDDTCMFQLKELVHFTKNNLHPLAGYTLFSKQKIEELRGLKTIDSLSLEELRAFTLAYREKFNAQYLPYFQKDDRRYSDKFKIVFMTQVLYECGLNPLVTKQSIQKALDRLNKYPELMMDVYNMRP